MLKLPRRLSETTTRQKRTALFWMAGTILTDQIWLRLITHYPKEDETHMVQIGLRQDLFYTGIPQATIHALLLASCLIGTAIILLRKDRRPDIG